MRDRRVATPAVQAGRYSAGPTCPPDGRGIPRIVPRGSCPDRLSSQIEKVDAADKAKRIEPGCGLRYGGTQGFEAVFDGVDFLVAYARVDLGQGDQARMLVAQFAVDRRQCPPDLDLRPLACEGFGMCEHRLGQLAEQVAVTRVL